MVQGCDAFDGEAQRLDESGQPVRVRVFVRTPDCTIHHSWHVSGLRGTGGNARSIDGVFVPARRAQPVELGDRWPGLAAPAPAPGAPPRSGPRSDARSMFAGPHFGAVALGIARAAIDAFTELATVKMPRGTRTLLRGQPEVQTCLGNAEALVSSARAWQDAVAVDGWNTVAAGGVLVAPEFYSIAGRVFLGLDPGPKPW